LQDADVTAGVAVDALCAVKLCFEGEDVADAEKPDEVPIFWQLGRVGLTV
jgi:hypothetical protein